MLPPKLKGYELERESCPRELKKIPAYLLKITKAFLYRLFYIFGLVWKTTPLITLSLTIVAVLNGVLPAATAYVAAELLNKLADIYVVARSGVEPELEGAVWLLILQFGLILISRLISHINLIVTRLAGELVSNKVRKMVMKKSKYLDLQSFDKPDFYERLENAQREAGMRPLQILAASFSTVSSVISMVSFIVLLAGISPLAPLIIILMAAPAAIVSFVYKRKIFEYVRRRSKDRRQLNYYSGIMINKDLVKEIKVFGLADLFMIRYDKVFKQYFKGYKELHIKECFWSSIISVISTLVSFGLFAFVALMVAAGKLMVGDYTLYTGALNSITSGMSSVINNTSTVYEGTLFIDNLITFMKEPVSVISVAKIPLNVNRHTTHTIELKNVSFKYPGSEKYVIKNISAVIAPGSTVSLVGLNGAGKTTLIKLITRLYDPTEGEILFDGQNIKDYDLDSLYKTFGIIFQDFGKYAVTVKENIAFGNIDEEIEDEKIKLAARQSNADEFISRLSMDYNTPLMRYFEEEGIELSIGQWQKLSVARAFYGDSDILILDEPTASLDALAEEEIYSQFDTLRKGKTTLFVSHRLSSVTSADAVWVLKEGELIERGSHSELMAKKGAYYKLFTTQAQRYINSKKGEKQL